jgi:hypothetical protein
VGLFDYLPSLNALQSERRAVPKHAITPAVITKVERKKAKKANEETFRKAVWERDRHRCRATGKPLARSGSDYEKVGEVHHCLKRSTAPELIYEPTNGILLSKFMHRLAETECPGDPSHCLLDIVGPDDRGEKQVFIFRDKDGKELRRRIG